MARRSHVSVTVKNEDPIDKKLRQLKKKIERESILRDKKKEVYFEPESQKKRKRLLRAIKMESLRRTQSRLT
jgi:ribosomal protein S21